MPQGDHNCARKCRCINQMRTAQLFRVSDRISQNQPAFRIGIENLNGLARKRRDNIPRSLRLAARHVLYGRNNRHHTDTRLQGGNRLHSPDRRRTTTHVVLHLLHALRRLNGDAARIKRHGLANQAKDIFRGSRRRVVSDHDQSGRLGAALCHTQQRTHAKLPHPVLVQNVNFQ